MAENVLDQRTGIKIQLRHVSSQRNKGTITLQEKMSYLGGSLDVTLRQGSFHLVQLYHHQLLLIMLKPIVRIVIQRPKFSMMKSNSIGLIVLFGYYMNQLGASPLQLSPSNWQELVQSLPWLGLERMYMNGINGFLIWWKYMNRLYPFNDSMNMLMSFVFAVFRY